MAKSGKTSLKSMLVGHKETSEHLRTREALMTRIWITPAFGDESTSLLVWRPEREQFELPSLSGNPKDAKQLRSLAVSRWSLPEQGFRMSNAPLARLSLNSFAEGKRPVGDTVIYSAWLPQNLPLESHHRLEWVSAKDVMMGFTAEGRSIDPQLREVLGKTGRFARGRLPEGDALTIGVTGHRDLAITEVPVLFDKLHQAIEDLEQEFSGRRLQVLSPLAEGADQLLADVALEHDLPLSVALPLPVDEYEADFTTPAALVEFRATLDRAAEWYTLPVAGGTTLEDLQARKRVRDEHYARVGRYVADNCDVLLALWDGRASTAVGGTADVLRYALQANRRPGERLLIRHIPTRREHSQREF